MDALAPPPLTVPPLPMVPLLVALPLRLAKLMLGVAVAPLGAITLIVIET
jgi:hypothetical protein